MALYSTLNAPRGGGNTLPSYLQYRTTRPVLESTPETADRLRAPTLTPTFTPNLPPSRPRPRLPAATTPTPGGVSREPTTKPPASVPTFTPPTGAPVPLSALGGYLEQYLGNPSQFGLPQVQQAYQYLVGDLERQAGLAENRAVADAARRGVYFGTPLTTSMGDIATELQRGRGDLATRLLLAQAQTGGQDRAGAINAAMQYGQNQLGAQQQAAQLGLQSLLAGYGGAPDINETLRSMVGLSTGVPQQDGGGGILDWIGALAPLAPLIFRR